MTIRAWLSAGVLCVLGTGCWDNVVTRFPIGLEPLEENTAPLPAPVGDDLFPEKVNIVTGEREDALYFGHAKGYVKAPIALVWEALRQTDVNTDRRGVDGWTRRDIEEDIEGVVYSYVIEVEVRSIIDTSYSLAWRHGVARGTVEEPEVVGFRWQKVYGIELITVLEGSGVLTMIDENTTQVEFIERLQAPTTGEETISSYLQDMYDETVLYTDGKPLPDYNE